MRITIDEDACKKAGLSIPEVLMILLIKEGVLIGELIRNMTKRKIIIEGKILDGRDMDIDPAWSDICDKILLSSEDTISKEDRLTKLAKDLMDCYPSGRKGTYCWKGNVREITLKLQKFFKLYGDKYTDEQLISATQRYVNSFNGNYKFMRILKYFIFKNERKVDSEGIGHIEEVSDLADYIENGDNEKMLKDDWMSTMI
jgi:hypothetical protein